MGPAMSRCLLGRLDVTHWLDRPPKQDRAPPQVALRAPAARDYGSPCTRTGRGPALVEQYTAPTAHT